MKISRALHGFVLLSFHLLSQGAAAQTVTEFSTPREGNDPPLPPGPTAATPEDVAAAIVASVESDAFVSYATTTDADTSARKAADPNAFLAQMREALAGLRGSSPRSEIDQEVE